MTELLEAASRLVAIRSVSRAESELAACVEEQLRQCADLSVERIGDNVVARSEFGRERRLVLAGHLDTVPPYDAVGPRIEGETLWGLGSVDMKGGLAVMLSLVSLLGAATVDITFIFYACEEVERSANGLAHLSREHPESLRADAAVLVEPTGGVVEAGCQGTMHAQVTLVGRRAHTARPYMGVNAIHRLGELLRVVASYEPRTVVLDGCGYTEQLQAVAVSGGVARNVVPDSASLTVNHRFAPDRDAAASEAWLRGLLDQGIDESLGDEVQLLEAVEGAPPALSDPMLSRLVQATCEPPRAKVGWTDVATFARMGIPATNFGPGDPLLAHTPDEHVSAAELSRARSVLEVFLVGDDRADVG